MNVSLDRLDDLADIAWASVAGLILLTISGRIAGGKKRGYALLGRMIDDYKGAWFGDCSTRRR